MTEFWIILGVVALLSFLASVFLDRVVNPWLGRRWSERALQKLREGKITPPHFDITVIWDSEGVFVRQDRPQEKSSRVAWTEIVRVTAFKRDLWTTDCICLFLEKSDKTGLEVHEEMNGWSPFADDLSKYLVGCKPWSEWFWIVATPAFKPNVTEIFCVLKHYVQLEVRHAEKVPV
jgi:hypothetical protein